MPSYHHAPAAIMQATDHLVAAARTLLAIDLTLEQKTCVLIGPDVLLVIQPLRNPCTPERRFVGYLASTERPLERLFDDSDCGPWHTATPGALIAVILDAYHRIPHQESATQTAQASAVAG